MDGIVVTDQDTVLQWRKDRRSSVLELRRAVHVAPFCAVDPGASGVAMAFPAPSKWPRGRIAKPLFLERLSGCQGARQFCVRAAARGIHVAVVEESFVSRGNPQSAIQLARTAGYFQGTFMALARTDAAIVNVPAASWQALFVSGRARRALRKKTMLTLMEPVLQGEAYWESANAEMKSAIADAMGIATWWESLGIAMWWSEVERKWIERER